MTRIQQPDPGTQGTSNRLGNRGEGQPFAAGAGKSGSYLDVLAPGGVRAAPDFAYCGVRGDEAAALIFCHLAFRHWADSADLAVCRFLVLHIRERMPVSRAIPASQAPVPARRAAVQRSKG